MVRRSFWVVSSVACAAIVLAGCQTPAAGPVASTPPETVITTQPTTTSPRPASPTGSWVMPNMVGSNLQVAQNAIQKLTGYAIFFTKSHDATGRGRSQILDRDWTVCAQNIAPGATITTESKIDFAVVKLTEHCP